MRTYETPYISDWFAISLRWAVMLGWVVSLALGGLMTTLPLFWPIGAMAAWNMGMTVLASLNTRIKYHRQVSLAVDILLSGSFFWAQGGLAGPVAWAGLLPVLAGAVYFEYWGTLISAGLFACSHDGECLFLYPKFLFAGNGLGRDIFGFGRIVRISWPTTGNPLTCYASEMARG